jgi:sodium transport system permease protein
VELNLGNSLIPITGVVLLLRTMLEGEFWQALPFVGPVVGVTLACCLFAIRWAIDQFNSESVLFRESERLDVGLWFKHLLRDRDDTPSAVEAVFCGVLILLIRFFMSFALPQPQSFRDLAVLTVITQLVMIGTPALLMAVMLTRCPGRTLGLRWPGMMTIPAAIGLAVALHPALLAINHVVQQLYPVSEHIQSQLKGLLAESPDLWQLVILLGVIPAVFEELAFRGFMLSGFRRLGHKWRAIALASFFFAITHAVFQQSITAFLIGLLLGYICVQSGSVLPGIFYHAVHNSLALGSAMLDDQFIAAHGWLQPLVSVTPHGPQYSWPVMIACGLAAMLLLAWFHGRSYSKTSEEKLQEAIEHHTTQPVTV